MHQLFNSNTNKYKKNTTNSHNDALWKKWLFQQLRHDQNSWLMHTTYSDNRKLYKLQTIQVTQISYKGKTRS